MPMPQLFINSKVSPNYRGHLIRSVSKTTAAQNQRALHRSVSRAGRRRLGRDLPGAAPLTGGVDLTQIDGIRPYTALKLLAEIGTDMTRWATAKHFTSWLTLEPHNKTRVAACSVPARHPPRIAPPSWAWPR